MTKTTNLKLTELSIGDVVVLLKSDGSESTNEPFQQMTVINKDKEGITFFRPYVHLSDFIRWLLGETPRNEPLITKHRKTIEECKEKLAALKNSI